MGCGAAGSSNLRSARKRQRWARHSVPVNHKRCSVAKLTQGMGITVTLALERPVKFRWTYQVRNEDGALRGSRAGLGRAARADGMRKHPTRSLARPSHV